MEDFIFALLFSLSIGTLLALILSIIALARSSRPSALRAHVESLEKRVRVLWNEVVVDRPAHERARVPAAAAQAPLPPLSRQPAMPEAVSPVTREEDAIIATTVETAEEPIAAQPVRQGGGLCPNCHSAWDLQRCMLCGYRATAVPPSPISLSRTQVQPPLAEHERSRITGRPVGSRAPAAIPPAPIPWKPLEGESWETVVGASWLNKIGVLVLVVGIALFIGYSLTQLGPAGRLAIGFAVSTLMLGIGIVLERQPPYRVFARGLAAGGWAGLYVTTYAMHGLEAARVIDNPTLALILLISVAAGMIAHSLYYRTEAVTALAYVCGFVAIAITPISLFSAIACVVLAGTLLVVAYRYSWDVLAVLGVIGTYGTFTIRYAEVLDGTKIWMDFSTGHAIVAVCWLLFEAFDIAIVATRRQNAGVGRTLLPLNACGLVGLSILHWGPDLSTLYVLFAAAAIAYLASTVIRAAVRPVSSFAADSHSLKRAFLGGYEAAITIAAALVTIAIWQKYHGAGWRLNVALLMEAEILFLAGILLRQSYLRALATPVFVLALARFALHDLVVDGVIQVATLEMMRWTPLALLVAAMFYFNRGILRPAKERDLLLLENAYSYVATALFVLVLGFETWMQHSYLRPEFLGVSWLVLALLLIEVALRARLVEFLAQSCVVGTLAIVTLVGMNGLLIYPLTLPEKTLQIWIWLAPAAAALYGTSARFRDGSPYGFQPDLLSLIRESTLAAASGMSVLFIWHLLPAPLVAVGWGILGLTLIQLGLRWTSPSLRSHGYAITGLVVGRLFLANFANPGVTSEISHRLLTVGPVVLLLYYLADRLAEPRQAPRVSSAERKLGRVYLYAAALVFVVLLRFELGRVVAVLGWAAFGLALLYIGVRFQNADLRYQSYLLALLTFARSWATNFYIPEGVTGLFGRVVTASIVIGALYLSQLLSPCQNRMLPAGTLKPLLWLDAHARALFCTLATVLLSVLLMYEAPARLLTAAWGVQGAALVLMGFSLRDPAFRLAGLGVLAVCLPKLFFYDLQQMETPYRIFSFVLLGLLLIAASWIYTRFKPQVRAYF